MKNSSVFETTCHIAGKFRPTTFLNSTFLKCLTPEHEPAIVNVEIKDKSGNYTGSPVSLIKFILVNP